MARSAMTPAAAAARPRWGWQQFLRRYGWCYFFVSPAIVFLGVFWAYPVVRSLALAFMRLNLRTGEAAFVGLQNFQDSVQNSTAWYHRRRSERLSGTPASRTLIPGGAR